MTDRPLKIAFGKAAGIAFFAAPASAAAATGLALGPVAFGAPWALLGLTALPALWWLMRATPPKPRIVSFPAMRILFNLTAEGQQPVLMPWWQRMIRLASASALIAGLAQPQLAPEEAVNGAGPVMLVIDNDWASAHNWQARIKTMNAMIDRAEREKRGIILMPTAAPAGGAPRRATEILTADAARSVINQMKPNPWPADRKAALNAVQEMSLKEPASVVWLSNGLNDGGAASLADSLKKIGSLSVVEDAPGAGARLLSPPEYGGENLTVTVRRANGGQEDRMTLSARDDAGNILETADAKFGPNETETTAIFEMSAAKRNKIVRVVIDGEQSAGAAALLDERFRRRPVGLIKSETSATDQSLLSEAVYIRRALEPYADIMAEGVDVLVRDQLAVMIMTDSAMIGSATQKKIQDWIQNGGTLLRFAGPRLAEQAQEKDGLLPVEIRQGERVLGAASGGKAVRVMPFEKGSPFYGIKVPDNIVIERGIMAQPGFSLEERTWAKLADGTPLVTAEQRGKGWVVLVHTTANTDWSDLALSGLFIDMMRAVVMHSHGVTGGDNNASPLPPVRVLDGYGQFMPPPKSVRPLENNSAIGPRNPPGFYGNESVQRAHNIGTEVSSMQPLPPMPEGVLKKTYKDVSESTDISGPLLAGALALLLADLAVRLAQQGRFTRRGKPETPAPSAIL